MRKKGPNSCMFAVGLFRVLLLVWLVSGFKCSLTRAGEPSQGTLKLEKGGSTQVYFSYEGKPLESKGIILHLLMWNGWQLRAADTRGADSYQWIVNLPRNRRMDEK